MALLHLNPKLTKEIMYKLLVYSIYEHLLNVEQGFHGMHLYILGSIFLSHITHEAYVSSTTLLETYSYISLYISFTCWIKNT
jgi:hypothetical protein